MFVKISKHVWWLRLPKVGCQNHRPVETWNNGFLSWQFYWSTTELNDVWENLRGSSDVRQNGWSILGVQTVSHPHRSSNFSDAFAPSAFQSNSPRHVLSKFHCCATRLSWFQLFGNQIEGSKNAIVDILARWSKWYMRPTAQRFVALYVSIVPSTKDIATVM